MIRHGAALACSIVLCAGSACGGGTEVDDAGGPARMDAGAITPSDSGALDGGGDRDAPASGVDAGAGADAGDAGAFVDAAGADATVIARDAAALRAFGVRCAADAECASGFCYDVHLSNPFCYGSVCTEPCTTWEDCDAYARSVGATGTTTRACVRHSVGDDLVCDFSWGGPAIDVECE